MSRDFNDLMTARWAEGRRLCIGFDLDNQKLTRKLFLAIGRKSGTTEVIGWFRYYAESFVRATRAFAACYKPNSAFFDREPWANEWLRDFVRIANRIAPSIPIILDAKYGDIGSTNVRHVERAFELIGADACTLNPYVGQVGLQPFLEKKRKGFFVLCRTSNPGAGEIQDLPISLSLKLRKELEGALGRELSDSSIPLYQLIAHRVSGDWNEFGNCGLVVGATYPGELVKVRELAPKLPILIPGVGTQGGDLIAAVQAAEVPGRGGFLLNVSSGIMYAADAVQVETAEEYFAVVQSAAKSYDNQITQALGLPIY